MPTSTSASFAYGQVYPGLKTFRRPYPFDGRASSVMYSSIFRQLWGTNEGGLESEIAVVDSVPESAPIIDEEDGKELMEGMEQVVSEENLETSEVDPDLFGPLGSDEECGSVATGVDKMWQFEFEQGLTLLHSFASTPSTFSDHDTITTCDNTVTTSNLASPSEVSTSCRPLFQPGPPFCVGQVIFAILAGAPNRTGLLWNEEYKMVGYLQRNSE